jgi:hypothetical protein
VSATVPALPQPIPDAGRRVLIYDGTTLISSIAANPSLGVQADDPSPVLPLVDLGALSGPVAQNLTNKIALIQRGGPGFNDKITWAAQAGARFAVIYDNTVEDGFVMGGTDFAPIPAVLIDKTNGDALHAALLATNLSAGLTLVSAHCAFTVTNTLLCEKVRVHVAIQHARRSDLRLVLQSPQGTRSIVSRANLDTNSCVEWTYLSTHHFYESSAGDWILSVADESTGIEGSVLSASLIIDGVEIVDTDHDGLDDRWEMTHFGSLDYGPRDDFDGDGFNNMREQIIGTDPARPAVDGRAQLRSAGRDRSRRADARHKRQR